MILYLLRMRRNVNRNDFNDRKNVIAISSIRRSLTLTGQHLFVELVMAVHCPGIGRSERTISAPHDGATAKFPLRVRQTRHFSRKFLADAL